MKHDQKKVIHEILKESLPYKHGLNEIQRKEKNVGLHESLGDFGTSLFDPLYFEREEKAAYHFVSADDLTLSEFEAPRDRESACQSNECNSSRTNWEFENICFSEKGSSVSNSGGGLTITTLEDTEDSEEDCTNTLRIEIEDEADCPRILTEGMMNEIYGQLSNSLQTYKWERCFAIGRDGDSFRTFLNLTSQYKHTVLVIRTMGGSILGGFASEHWKSRSATTSSSPSMSNNRYYGNGQAFLFSSYYQHSINEQNQQLDFYRWVGSNDYCQVCDVEKGSLAMGGVGDFGLMIGDDFHRGATGSSETFANPALVIPGNFEIAEFEVYGLLPLSSVFAPMASCSSAKSLLSLTWYFLRKYYTKITFQPDASMNSLIPACPRTVAINMAKHDDTSRGENW